jgi:hypothetical protein
VGERVGDTVGEAEGDSDGEGVGTDTSYVGTKVGVAVGALVGLPDGTGVGLPNLYVGDSVGVPREGSAVGTAVGDAVDEKMTMIGSVAEIALSVAVLMYTTLSTESTAVTYVWGLVEKTPVFATPATVLVLVTTVPTMMPVVALT